MQNPPNQLAPYGLNGVNQFLQPHVHGVFYSLTLTLPDTILTFFLQEKVLFTPYELAYQLAPFPPISPNPPISPKPTNKPRFPTN